MRRRGVGRQEGGEALSPLGSGSTARVGAVAGKRVAIIDDVISTGGSITAALRLVRRIGGNPVALGCMLTEGDAWRAALGADAGLVRSLGRIPVFARGPEGALDEVWEG